MAMSNCPGMHGIGGVAVGIGVGAGVAVGVGAAGVGVCDTSGPPPLDAGVEEPQAATMPTAATSTVETRTRRIRDAGYPQSGRHAHHLSAGTSWSACSAGANRSPTDATRSAIVVMFQRSGRRSGSSSSAHAIGVETGAPGAGRREYGAASVLLMMFCV